MHRYLVEMLECPACHGSLAWDIASQEGERILAGIARCHCCDAEYPIREGIGLFLTPDLPRNDLWEEGEQYVSQMLSEHPEIEAQLMEVPISDLGPADCFIRCMVHEDRKEWDRAQQAFDVAQLGLYTDEYKACQESQIDYILGCLENGSEPIIDLASGRCYLVEKLLRNTKRPIVITDFSKQVLRRNREWLIHHRLISRASLLAFDARRTPFRDGSISTMTTNVGLPNIEKPGELLKELRRVVAGRLLAISLFYPESDAINVAALREYGLADSMLRKPVLAGLENADWQAEARNLCSCLALPTPKSEVFPDQGIDGFPVAETTLDWCVIEAS